MQNYSVKLNKPKIKDSTKKCSVIKPEGTGKYKREKKLSNLKRNKTR
jgi:hypothetical protein